jgi:UDP-N-acetylmuramyl tripeptide synthase
MVVRSTPRAKAADAADSRLDTCIVALPPSATMQVSNLLSAASAAFALGVDLTTIADALREFLPAPETLPGSFNVFDGPSCSAYVDCLTSTAGLRMVLRAINPGGKRRQLTVLGDLSAFAPDDVNEIGRLLGRYQGAIILHSNPRSRILDAFRRGISANQFPPVVIHLPTERRALNRALKTVRPEDVLLVLHQGEPGMALRAIDRFMFPTSTNVHEAR